jgi:predicted nucleic acid-binding protein
VILYVDSSSILSIHILEAGRHEAASKAIDQSDVVATSPITYAEVRSGLARARYKENPPRMDERQYQIAVTDFNRDWPAYFRINPAARLIRTAGDLAERHRLRGYDALHLASVLALRNRVPDQVWISTWDEELADAGSLFST